MTVWVVVAYLLGLGTFPLAVWVGKRLAAESAKCHGVCGAINQNFNEPCALIEGHPGLHQLADGWWFSDTKKPTPIGPLIHVGVNGAMHLGHGLSCTLCQRITKARKG